MPPKNDSSSANSEATAGESPKKTTRRRAATTTPRAPRAKSTRKAAAPAESAPELAFTPEPAPPPRPQAEPEQRERSSESSSRQADHRETDSRRAEPEREERHQREERGDQQSAPAQSENRDSNTRRSETDSPAPQPAVQSPQPKQESSDGAAPPEPQSHQAGAPSGGHNQGGQQQGEWQDRGGGGGRDRDFWKRNKRKRGRHGGGGGGGHWQPSGGGAPAPREQHPPQPPPPSTAPTFGELPNPSRFNDLAALETQAQEISSGPGEPIYQNSVYAMNLAELTAFARSVGAVFEGAPNRKQLLTQIITTAAEQKRALRDRGYIDVTDRGAFIVHEHVNYRLYPEDPYLPESLIKLYGLKRGHRVEVSVQAPLPGERCPSVLRVDSVMGMPAAEISKVTPFEELVPYYPLQRILLESEETQKDVSMRAVDILTPVGFGQRALIVAPPRTGKTVLLQNIANSITENSPHAKLILLLIDERPEEVTDFKRHTKGEVVSSTFDETPESHCAEMVIENARRRVELGEHVVILLDSITRLARAYNALTGNQGKTMSGGLESNALQKPKRFFGSARNIEGGGSLTIIASALIDTGSRMDEIIFEEFKGTGNCELHLDRGLVERRIFPAINIDRSGTRKEELIYHPEELQRIYGLRRAMQGLGPIESMEMLITRLKKTKSNAEFLLGLSRT
jgi:transcription termination factor Rho